MTIRDRSNCFLVCARVGTKCAKKTCVGQWGHSKDARELTWIMTAPRVNGVLQLSENQHNRPCFVEKGYSRASMVFKDVIVRPYMVINLKENKWEFSTNSSLLSQLPPLEDFVEI